jgi:hypothetical protein
MATVALASLDTFCGALHIYDMVALFAIIEKTCTAPPSSAKGDTLHKSDQNILVDGFSTESWAQYARKKGGIASSVCKHNGELKAEIATLKARLCISSSACDQNVNPAKADHDPLFAVDPWALATSPLKPQTKIPEEICTTSDAWATWEIRSHLNDEQTNCSSTSDSMPELNVPDGTVNQVDGGGHQLASRQGAHSAQARDCHDAQHEADDG